MRILKLLLGTEALGYVLDVRWLYNMSPYNYSSHENSEVQNSMYNIVPLCKN